MPIRALRQDRRLPRCAEKVAIARGPLVYCLESVDNPQVDIFDVTADIPSLQSISAPETLGGITLLQGAANSAAARPGTVLTLIPYMLWANRGPSQMNVFVRA